MEKNVLLYICKQNVTAFTAGKTRKIIYLSFTKPKKKLIFLNDSIP